MEEVEELLPVRARKRARMDAGRTSGAMFSSLHSPVERSIKMRITGYFLEWAVSQILWHSRPQVGASHYVDGALAVAAVHSMVVAWVLARMRSLQDALGPNSVETLLKRQT